MAIGVYPGSFNPPTVAHLAIAEAAVLQCGLDRVDLVISRHALGKDPAGLVALEHRVAVLGEIAATRPWLSTAVSDDRLIADIARGYDVVVLGADKWEQVADAAWYDGDPDRRDAVVAGLPRLALAPRAGSALTSVAPPPGTVLLDVPAHLLEVSATAARSGRADWMAPEARAAARWPL